jgi:hypothetical protein
MFSRLAEANSKMDKTPINHALIAVAVQVASGLWFGDWIAGAALACTWFVAREHTQAEYRWIAKFGGGKRANLTAMGWADKRIWDIGSVLDFAVPVIACLVVYFLSPLYLTI